jgi:sec-independent protein translocase protein TatB
MFDLGWTELLLIGTVALIVVGPKDLPLLFRKVGKFVGKARGMAREFSRAMDDAADEAGVKEVAKSLKAASNPLQAGVDQVKSVAADFTKYSPESEADKLAAKGNEPADKVPNASAKKATELKSMGKATANKTSVKKTATNKAASKKSPVPKTTENKTVAKRAVTKSNKQPVKATAKASKAIKD